MSQQNVDTAIHKGSCNASCTYRCTNTMPTYRDVLHSLDERLKALITNARATGHQEVRCAVEKKAMDVSAACKATENIVRQLHLWEVEGLMVAGVPRDAKVGQLIVSRLLVLVSFRTQYAKVGPDDFHKISSICDEGLRTFTRMGRVVDYNFEQC